MKSGLKIFGNIFSWLVIFALVIAVIGVTVPQVMGVRMYTVLTGSMEPTYKIGDLVYVVPEDFSKINVGDVITYSINSQGTVVTHRVIEKDANQGVLYTKGDNNNTPDGIAIQAQNIVGVVKFSIPKIGKVVTPLETLYGKIAAICAILIIVILINLIPYLFNKDDNEQDDDEQEKKK